MDSAATSHDDLDGVLESSLRGGAMAESLRRSVRRLQEHDRELEVQNVALRHAQKMLESSLQRYADLYEHLPIGYLSLTRSGRVLEANRTAAEMLRCSLSEMRGRELGEFLVEEDVGRFKSHLDDCVRTRAPVLTDATLRLDGDQTLAVQLSSRPSASADGVATVVHTALTDISETKRAQAILEEVNAEQEAFTHSISHDLRAPLVTIINYSQLLAAELGPQIGQEHNEILHRVQRAASRMELVLKNLLQYSRVARADILKEPINLSQLVRELLMQHQGVIQESHARIDVQNPLPPMYGSEQLLSQVISNLLTNAVKYTHPGREPVIHISGQARGNEVVLTVRDEGIGIAPEFHDRIFQVFERLHGQSAYPGTGLGLAIVQRAMERMGGRVWVESEVGKGSSFHVALPPVPTP